MKQKKTLRPALQWALLCVQGALVGAGAILPGISGGVLCVAFGIYEPMMALLSHPVRSFRTYYRMFVPFLIGWVGGFLLLARAVSILFESSASAALALFAGLVLGTVPELMKKSERSGPRVSWTGFVLPIAVLFVLLSALKSGSAAAVAPNTAWYFFSGAVWGLSLVIPGLSSSTILIYMGLYQPMAEGIAAVNPGVVLPLLGGLAVTAALSARLVNHLLETKYALMSRIILGIIIVPTLLTLPTQFADAGAAVLAAACFAAGFAASRWMDLARDRMVPEESSRPACEEKRAA
jgi:putative membrane protein